MTFVKTTALATAAALTLAGCEGYENTGKGAAIGAVVGTIGGQIIGGNKGGRKTGAVLGTVLGAAIGNTLDKQEAELRETVGDSGATITNTGSSLIVTLPEAITFDTDSTFVRGSLQNTLNDLSNNLQKYPNSIVEVIGHTDNVGDPSYNQNLSARRAQAVSSILVNNNIPSHRIRAYGRGETSPAADNQSSTGRAQNRRVEIVIVPTNAT
jgi:outer membrane protein OmpA-like peptidoglycan-associated protein